MKIIPIADQRVTRPLDSIPVKPAPFVGLLTDSRGRRLHDLRISVTDRCNFRCTYCMPSSVFDKDYAFLPQSALLSFEEIERLVRVFVGHGVEKIRLTGGEPLLRKNLERLVESLARIQTINGRDLDLTLTTNASLLGRKAKALREAGLRRITVSLDALDEPIFQQMNDVDFPVADVLNGIDAAAAAGFDDIKINMVVKRGVNDSQIIPMAQYFKGSHRILRFIEYMDVGTSNGWRMDDVMPSIEVIKQISQVYPLMPIDANYPGEVAKRWRYTDGSGEVGVISSVTESFCHECTRLRLSTEGKLFTCLFATEGYDVRALLRSDFTDAQISSAVASYWQVRKDNYSEERTSLTPELRAQRDKVEMSYIGG